MRSSRCPAAAPSARGPSTCTCVPATADDGARITATGGTGGGEPTVTVTFATFDFMVPSSACTVNESWPLNPAAGVYTAVFVPTVTLPWAGWSTTDQLIGLVVVVVAVSGTVTGVPAAVALVLSLAAFLLRRRFPVTAAVLAWCAALAAVAPVALFAPLSLITS